MFDLSLAHIHRAERERDIAADLRIREILKTVDASAALRRSPSPGPASPRSAARVRALGR
jgi:hypothetical protein